MATIGNVASYVRSKNAGPFWVTVDIFCNTLEQYQQIANSKNLTKDNLASVYQVQPEYVKLFFLPDLKVVKISYPRSCPQGGPDERDMHSGQQYIQLLDFVL